MPRNRGTRAEQLRPAVIGYDDLPGIQPVGAGDWIRWLNFAYPGWGKTSAWGTAADAGMRTLIVRSSLDVMPARIMKSGAEQYVADSWEKMYQILDFLRMANHGYLWVFWDNISVHQDVLLDDVWEGTVAVNPRRAYILGDNGQPTGPNLSPSSGLDRGEYGRNMERIQQWVRHMVGCNSFHFGIGAHPLEGQHPTNDEGGALLRPYVQGKMMTEKICGYCNIVTFMELCEGQDDKQNEIKWRRLHFQESSRYYAKDLYDAFPKGYLDIVNDTSTVPNMMSAIEKARGKGLGAQTTPSRRGRRR